MLYFSMRTHTDTNIIGNCTDGIENDFNFFKMSNLAGRANAMLYEQMVLSYIWKSVPRVF